VPLGIATTTGNFMVGITARARVYVYYGGSNVDPMAVIPRVFGALSGTMMGVYILSYLGVSWLRLALSAVRMFVSGIWG
jgi:uncharacterized membrane protein YfcA